MAEQMNTMEADEVCDEFWLNEFIDRYGMRLTQLGNIVSQIAPLAEAANSISGDGGS